MSETRTAAEDLVATLAGCGVEVCFANPGTSEMHMVAAIDKVPGLRPVLCLFEGVATGAADGYARMAGKPALTLLHLGPGMANGAANLHNAQKARSPMVNIVGDHATFHQHHDAPLASDIQSYARPFSGWYRECRNAADLSDLGAEAVAAAQQPPGQIATLVVPADCAWSKGGGVRDPLMLPDRAMVAGKTIDEVAAALKQARNPAILMTGSALASAEGIARAAKAALAAGARLYCDTFNQRIARGAGRIPVTPLPYFAEMGVEALENTDLLVLVETKPPVAFFAYPGRPSTFAPPDCRIMTLARAGENAIDALAALADALGATEDPPVAEAEKPALPTGDLTTGAIGHSLGHLLPDGAIVSDEMITAGLASTALTARSAPHDWLQLTGGAIGQGLPLAVGAAIACPDRKVMALQADGSAMYTCQALWTMARENLDITVVLFSNRSYDVLKIELARVGAENPGPKAFSMLDLGNPDLNWVQLSQGMGVEAHRATTAEEFTDHLARCLKEKGPRLIEAMI